MYILYISFFFQAEDGIRDLVRSRGLGDVYKRQEFDDELEKEGDNDGEARDADQRELDRIAYPVHQCLSLIHI